MIDQMPPRKTASARWGDWLTLALLVGLLSGCTTTWPARRTYVVAGGIGGQSHNLQEGVRSANGDGGGIPLVVIHVPGISGIWPTDRNWAYGLQDAGIGDIRKFEWTGPIALLNLFDDDLHERKARALVEMVRAVWAENEVGTRIVITAHSGGTRVALLAIEMLAEDLATITVEDGKDRNLFVEQVWLIATALDPDYDLAPTLNYVSRLVSVQSAYDGFILGAGTSVFGTADNHHGDAAGKVGFNTEDPRLEVWDYGSDWRKFGAGSGHLGILRRQLAHEVVGPSILHWPAEGPWDAIFRRSADAAGSEDTMVHDDESN